MNIPYFETINAKYVIGLFDKMMQPNNQTRILLLEGASKMGKTHLLSKVFFTLASQRYQAHCIVIDLQRKPLTIVDILHSVYEDLGEQVCPSYQAAFKEKIRHKDINVVVEKTLALKSRIDIDVKSEVKTNDFQLWVLHLTKQIMNDLKKFCINTHPLVFLIDNVSNANEAVKAWLMDTFLKELIKVEDVRIVIAGKDLPKANLGYVSFSERHQLTFIRDIGEYTIYCANSQETYPAETIKIVAILSDFTPGFFIENMLKIRLSQQWGENERF